MASKKFEINLTPQNTEWFSLIPNPESNNDIIFNKLFEMAINEGLMLEVISASLTVSDLSKFKSVYSKMQSKRAEFFNDMHITPTHTERKKVTQTISTEVEEETIIPEVIEKPKADQKKKTVHGFDESTF